MDSFDRHRGAILSLYYGTSKTVLALYLAAALHRKTLVVVAKSFLCDKWEERARQLLPSVRVERIRQDIIDVAGKDIVHSAPERCRCRAASDGPASVTLNSF
jgi:superfamily II DNA or RNA helicase